MSFASSVFSLSAMPSSELLSVGFPGFPPSLAGAFSPVLLLGSSEVSPCPPVPLFSVPASPSSSFFSLAPPAIPSPDSLPSPLSGDAPSSGVSSGGPSSILSDGESGMSGCADMSSGASMSVDSTGSVRWIMRSSL